MPDSAESCFSSPHAPGIINYRVRDLVSPFRFLHLYFRRIACSCPVFFLLRFFSLPRFLVFVLILPRRFSDTDNRSARPRGRAVDDYAVAAEF